MRLHETRLKEEAIEACAMANQERVRAVDAAQKVITPLLYAVLTLFQRCFNAVLTLLQR